MFRGISRENGVFYFRACLTEAHRERCIQVPN